MTQETWALLAAVGGAFLANFIQSWRNGRRLKRVHELQNGETKDKIQRARREIPPQVLVIDDNDSDQELQAYVLRRCGCDVFQAKTGREAHELILSRIRRERGWPFDFVLLDLRLSHAETAIEVLDMLNRLIPTVEIVICTGHASDRDLKTILEEGYFVITKPLTDRHVNKILANHGLRTVDL